MGVWDSVPGEKEENLTPIQKLKYCAIVLLFSIIGYGLGCFVHSEFFHHFFTWIFTN